MVANKGLRLRTEVLQFATKNGYTCVRRLRRLAVKLLPTVAVRRTRTPAPRLRCFGASFRSGLGSGRFLRLGRLAARTRRPYATGWSARTYPMKKELGPIRVRTISLVQRVRRSMPVG